MELLFGFFLILAAGFFAGSETAVYRSNWIRLTNWASRNIAGSKSALHLLDRRETTVVVTLVGTNLCVVFATVLFSRFFEARYGPAYATVAVVLVIVLTILLGEYVPKAIAQAFPDRWLVRTVLPLSVSGAVFAPAVFVLSGIARFLAGPVAGAGQRFTLTRQERPGRPSETRHRIRLGPARYQHGLPALPLLSHESLGSQHPARTGESRAP